MQYYHVKNWQRFQHYKDRNPPWIKLHYEIMTSADWVMLADASKLLAVVCMLIASRNEGRVPADPHYFKRVAYLDKMPDFKPLLLCGFLEMPLADASDCKQPQADARPETEAYSTDTEKESKRERAQSKSAIASRIASDWELPEGWGDWAETQGMTSDAIIKEADKFKDFWLGKPGKDGTKIDWQATWRNWIRRHLEGAKR